MGVFQDYNTTVHYDKGDDLMRVLKKTVVASAMTWSSTYIDTVDEVEIYYYQLLLVTIR